MSYKINNNGEMNTVLIAIWWHQTDKLDPCVATVRTLCVLCIVLIAYRSVVRSPYFLFYVIYIALSDTKYIVQGT